MQRINKELKWYAFRYDINKRDIDICNVISDELIKTLKKRKKSGNINNLLELKDAIDDYFRYYYQYKSEHEVIISDIFGKDESGKKVDIYWQIYMNLDRLTEYINNNLKIVEV